MEASLAQAIAREVDRACTGIGEAEVRVAVRLLNNDQAAADRRSPTMSGRN